MDEKEETLMIYITMEEGIIHLSRAAQEFEMKTVQEEIRKGPWTEQEDFQLVCFVGLFGDRRWDFIAKVSGLKVAGDDR
ncbi:hypothetical protein SAY87_013204 [Trapa incisa]|uniref:Myb-like domain-containing protein n=1 Tax=Trapa incisa TaxID=236973 RepID=A0AAN7KBH2_9MYRT|nr:hypothetical protein SAY87_013204 [Trapa incisa]